MILFPLRNFGVKNQNKTKNPETVTVIEGKTERGKQNETFVLLLCNKTASIYRHMPTHLQ